MKASLFVNYSLIYKIHQEQINSFSEEKNIMASIATSLVVIVTMLVSAVAVASESNMLQDVCVADFSNGIYILQTIDCVLISFIFEKSRDNYVSIYFFIDR